jgi:Icc-related predicted phosphoesterase
MSTGRYLVFGDLHGRILPAFRFATFVAQEMGAGFDGLLQVGDLGYFPDVSRLDKATLRHAKDDPSELGALDVVQASEVADWVFEHPLCPETMWFIPGNHEDYHVLNRLAQTAHRERDFVVDAYCKIRCIKNGSTVTLPGGLTVGGLWGIDGTGGDRRKKLPDGAYLSESKATQLLGQDFEVLLTHDSAIDAKRVNCGSQLIRDVIELKQPRFAFFGHYHGDGSEVEPIRESRLFHLSGFELHGRDGTVDLGSVGLIEKSEAKLTFQWLDESLLKQFSRHNWKHVVEEVAVS